MRDHVGVHIKTHQVDEAINRCGFCGLTESNCTIEIRSLSGKIQPSSCTWPASNCPYFKNFSLKMSRKSIKDIRSINRPVECYKCSQIVWSFNMRAHNVEFHKEVELVESPFDSESTETFIESSSNEPKSSFDLVPCKICHGSFPLTKMRDHVGKHILCNEVDESSIRCGFCGLTTDQCLIEIKTTSGKGKNTKYGPYSNCKYFRKFNLKSSTRPTKTGPSTNRPIECHLCKNVYWSYNMIKHFSECHSNENPPELITQAEKEMVIKG
jgi:hypothetical protein